MHDAGTSVQHGKGTPSSGHHNGLPWIEDTRKVVPGDARALSNVFFDRLQVLDEGTREHQYARNTLIEMNISLVRFAARRFRNRGSGDMEDIVQVGTIGLIKAIDRFDLSREVKFSSFAVPYIIGEIKRSFRDTSWAVHVPRRMQEMRVDLARAKESLCLTLGRDPTVGELAGHLEITADLVREGLIAAHAYSADSLDVHPTSGDEVPNARALADTMGEPDPRISVIDNLRSLAPLLGELDPRERRIIDLRFGQDMTQAQIGNVLGLSQMHISRLLSRILSELRRGMLADS
ncbi:SigB/SigF/SigG family RNA polymerase sigma factor [Streptomyces lycii]|uniref:SigB/SigF/SigG family RNA polymerase sigma factor n=1 Tax=Streptomyces lycii TaxID=2654337 RepID=A0ABQ7FF02_9ACTN|nr:SigB/SigF/SigG family RNA polymerase sigma factor [Streptomyces lycii]